MSEQKLTEKLNQIKELVDECLTDLNEKRRPRQEEKRSRSAVHATSGNVDFSLNERAFIKRYARSLSGVKKFVVLVAYLAGGKVGHNVELKEVQRNWNKMKAGNLLGMKFNTFYSTSAKDNGWVDSPRNGVYTLRSSWIEVFKAD